MGYSIDTSGSFEIDKPLDNATIALIKDYTKKEGSGWEYIVVKNRYFLEYPEDFQDIESFEDTLKVIVKTILEPRGFTVNGEFDWDYPEEHEFGRVVIENNAITVLDGEKTYVERYEKSDKPVGECFEPKCNFNAKANEIVEAFTDDVDGIFASSCQFEWESDDLGKARAELVERIHAAFHH